MAKLDQWVTALPAKEADNESGLKAAFAAELLKSPTEPFKAALVIFPNDTSKALRVANFWVADPIVKAETKRLSDEQGELAFLPSKAALARSLWERAHAEDTPDEDYTKQLKLYAEVMGFIENKSGGNGSSGPRGGTNGMQPAQVFAAPLDEQI